MKERLVIGSRGSRLALWQAEWVKAQVEMAHPSTLVVIEIIKTSGDVLKDAPLAVIGGQGVFTKELEEALLAGRIDLAVHSLKDLPTVLPESLTIAAVTAREDARDALILPAGQTADDQSLTKLRQGAIVGTSSPRRLAQIKHLRSDLRIKELRGNVDTRLRKLDAGAYDAIILAAAGLRRLGWAERISAYLSTQEMLPAVGQGALGIETRAADQKTNALLSAIEDPLTRAACWAERALLRELGGGCQLPIAAHATVKQNKLRLDGLVASVSGDRLLRDKIEGAQGNAVMLGQQLAQRLLERGADSLLETPPV